jgi:hypothetical protein
MDTMAEVAILGGATVLAAGAAFGMAWAFLQGAFRLMQPAAARPAQRPRLEIVRGTRAVARGFAGSR